MKRIVSFVVLLAALCVANVDAQVRTRRMPDAPAVGGRGTPDLTDAQKQIAAGAATKEAAAKTAAEAEAKAKAEADAAAATAGPLVITTAVPATMEATREYEFQVTVTGGTAPYELTVPSSCDEELNDRGWAITCTPSADASGAKIDLTFAVTDKAGVKSERTFPVQVTPFVATITDTYEVAEAARESAEKAASREFPTPPTADEIATAVMDSNTVFEDITLNETLRRVYRNTERTFNRYGPLMLLSAFLVGVVVALLIRRFTDGQAIKELRERGAGTASMFILCLLGASTAFAQTPPVRTAPAAPGAAAPAVAPAAATPTPAPTTDAVIEGFSPRYVVAGSRNVTFTLRGKNLDQLPRLAFNPEFTLRTKKDASGADVPDLRVNAARTTLTGVWTLVNAETEGGYNGFQAFKADGTEVTHTTGFTVIDADLAAFVRASAQDTATRSFLQAVFVETFGEAEGNRLYNAYLLRPTLNGARDVLQRGQGQIGDRIVTATNSLRDEVNRTVVEAVRAASQTLAEANARNHAQVSGRVDRVEQTVATVSADTTVALEAAATLAEGNKPRRVGGVIGLQRQVNPGLATTLRQRLAEAARARAARLDVGPIPEEAGVATQ